MASTSSQRLRDRAYAAMVELERARQAVEVGRKFSVELSPLVTSKAADASLVRLRARLADQLYTALRAARRPARPTASPRTATGWTPGCAARGRTKRRQSGK